MLRVLLLNTIYIKIYRYSLHRPQNNCMQNYLFIYLSHYSSTYFPLDTKAPRTMNILPAFRQMHLQSGGQLLRSPECCLLPGISRDLIYKCFPPIALLCTSARRQETRAELVCSSHLAFREPSWEARPLLGPQVICRRPSFTLNAPFTWCPGAPNKNAALN